MLFYLLIFFILFIISIFTIFINPQFQFFNFGRLGVKEDEILYPIVTVNNPYFNVVCHSLILCMWSKLVYFILFSFCMSIHLFQQIPIEINK